MKLAKKDKRPKIGITEFVFFFIVSQFHVSKEMKSDLETLHGCVLSRPLPVRSFWDILKLHSYFMNFFPFSTQGMISIKYAPG
jgi:hypothetical protein